MKVRIHSITSMGFLTLLIFTPVLLRAQTAHVKGNITDLENNPLPQASIFIRSEKGYSFQVKTNDEGMFLSPALFPGTYTLHIQKKGYQDFQLTIHLKSGHTHSIQIKLVPIDQVLVTSPVYEDVLLLQAHETSWSTQTIETLPTTRDPWSVLELTPGIVMKESSTGVEQATKQVYFYAYGESRKNAHWYLDGIPITDPEKRGRTQIIPDFSSLEEIRVISAQGDVESFSGGVQIHMITKRGGKNLEGEVVLNGTSSILVASKRPSGSLYKLLSPQPSLRSLFQGSFSLGGKLPGTRIFVWSSYGNRIHRLEKSSGFGTPLLEQTTLHDAQVKFDIPYATGFFEILFHWNGFYGKNLESNFSRAPETTLREIDRTPLVKLHLERLITPHILVSIIGGGIIRRTNEAYPESGKTGIPVFDIATDRWLHGYEWRESQQTTGFLKLAMEMSYRSHEFKLGVEGYTARVQMNANWGPGITYLYNNLSDPSQGGEVRFYRENRVNPYLWRLSMYAQDTFQGKNVSVTAGIRYDIQWVGRRRMNVPANVFIPSWLPSAKDDGGRLPFTWITVSPRISITWRPSASNRFQMIASTALYPSTLDFRQAIDLSTTSYRMLSFLWPEDTNGNGVPDMNEIDFLHPIEWSHDPFQPNESNRTVAPSFASPLNFELTGGLIWQPSDQTTLEFIALYRRTVRRKEKFPYPIGNPETFENYFDCWTPAGTLPPQWGGWPYYECSLSKPEGEIWMNQPGYHRDYFGGTLTWNVRYSKLKIFGSFSLEKYIHHYTNRRAYLDPTNIEQKNRHDVTFGKANARWFTKIGIQWNPITSFRSSLVLLARDGFPFLSVYKVERKSNGWGRVIKVYTHPPGTLRLPDVFLMNIRFEYGLSFRKKEDVILSLDVFNALNRRTILQKYTRADQPALYGKPTEIMGGRLIRLGVRFLF